MLQKLFAKIIPLYLCSLRFRKGCTSKKLAEIPGMLTLSFVCRCLGINVCGPFILLTRNSNPIPRPVE